MSRSILDLIALLVCFPLLCADELHAQDRYPPADSKFTDSDFHREFDRFDELPASSHAASPTEPTTAAQPAGQVISRSSRPISRSDADSDSIQDSSIPQPPSLWTVLGSLAFILFLIFAAGALWKKHGPQQLNGLPAEVLEVLGRKHLSQQQSIHLIRCGTRLLIVGSSTNGLQTLAEVTDPVEVDYLAGLCRSPEVNTGFGQSLRDWFQKQTSPSPNSPVADAEPRYAGQAPHSSLTEPSGPSLELEADFPSGHRASHLEEVHG